MPKASNLGSCSSQLKGSPDGRWDTEGESSAPKTYELMIVASSAQVDSLLSCVAVMLCQGEAGVRIVASFGMATRSTNLALVN